MGQSPVTRGLDLRGPSPRPHIAHAFARTIAYRSLFIYECDALFMNASLIITHDPGVERSSYVVRQFIILPY